ncbi:DUF3857 domain-containing protein [Mangrovibacterium diazotrophicum]|uniref:Transglutaminase superfamily protein n=1 Tax=Mangrovibacterium diazotrophicum TaxID=1261403 RepID=A0A419WAC9_9BACT|nr:DUF3857 domain-containing protein [Mangrovibacterium diazotrophicum]RKD92399.1 transglutaminase superfamily protein [Mangrovibacterium diazotrophicum]
MIHLKLFFSAWLLALGLSLCANANDAELLYRLDEITVDGGKLVTKSTIRIQINNKAGEEYATVQIPYSKISKVSDVEVRLLAANGALVRKLNSSEIKKKSAVSDAAFFDDNMEVEFSLKHSRYPYIVEYSYERRESEFLFIDFWMPILSLDIPTRDAELSLTVPVGFQLRYGSQLVDDPVVSDNGKTINYRWKTHFDAYREKEVFSPPVFALVPWVKIIPNNFQYEIPGSSESWETFGNWEFSLLDGLDDLPDAEKLRISKLVEGVDDKLEKAKILYHDLQDRTHYVLVSIETGGWKPYPASYVAANRYGDCKALTNYMKAVFEYAGIECNYVDIFAGDRIRKLDREIPSPEFNHVILMVPMEKDSLWLDCTSKGPFGYVGTFIQNRDVFVVGDGKSYFARTPALQAEDVAELRTVHIGYPSPSTSTVQFDCTFKGTQFERLRSLDESFNTDDRTRIFRNYFVADGFELQDYSIEREDRDSAFVAVKYQATTNRFYQNYGAETVVKNLPFLFPKLQKPGQRQLPLQVDYPDFERDTLVYELPTHLSVEGRTEDVALDTKYGRYSFRMEVGDREVRVIKELEIYPGTYSLAEYPGFYDFIDDVKTYESKPLLILNN